MNRIRRATEDEMVLAFLRAERGSRRWGEYVSQAVGERWALLDDADLTNASENAARRSMLDYRGYSSRIYLFRGFPDNVEWWLVRLPRSEVGDLMFALGICDELTQKTRKVAIAARNAATIPCQDGSLNASIAEIVETDLKGASFEPLITASRSPETQHVLIEGYARACAYSTNTNGADVDALVGYSSAIPGWTFWGLP
jgi:hypothetical protein